MEAFNDGNDETNCRNGELIMLHIIYDEKCPNCRMGLFHSEDEHLFYHGTTVLGYELDSMVKNYLRCAVWADSLEGCEKDYGSFSASQKMNEQADSDCLSFIEFLSKAGLIDWDTFHNFENLGYDFWLTRNRHDSGFWDGDWEKGDEMTEIVHKNFPEKTIWKDEVGKYNFD